MTRFWKSVYKKEPISSFLIVAGVMDVAIGGIGESWSLATFGASVVAVALVWRWWKWQRRPQAIPLRSPAYFLPESPQSQLPTLKPTPKPAPKGRR
ncbi:hypothetical protein [Geitlerinema sp. PCC 9228]|uniref:hypothetical protein n=1 Tax=Geitlerinema sp. PCC 9228 TaxID=111611 RepID=UPI001FCD5048|nr:hypothetical protein [Geitlerinema sp. PCC 9228]